VIDIIVAILPIVVGAGLARWIVVRARAQPDATVAPPKPHAGTSGAAAELSSEVGDAAPPEWTALDDIQLERLLKDSS
jgi:hypothetical protein